MLIDIIIPTNHKLDEIRPLINEIEYNTPEQHRIISTCQPVSAAKNRNYGLSFANSDIITMLDDDVTGFYPGWLTNMIFPLLQDPDIIMCSARLLNKDRTRAQNMGMVNGSGSYQEIPASYNIDGIEYKRVTTAVICFRKNDVRFDENFQGSGYEDTAFMDDISAAHNGMKFIVNNACELIHLNEMKGQGDPEIWQQNHDYYCKKYPWDIVAKNQKYWGPECE